VLERVIEPRRAAALAGAVCAALAVKVDIDLVLIEQGVEDRRVPGRLDDERAVADLELRDRDARSPRVAAANERDAVAVVEQERAVDLGVLVAGEPDAR
jgi:hypothetical protein